MQQSSIKIYNTLTRKLESFQPIHPSTIGMYVCGPTVYGPAHLGHARSAIVFDIIVRTFQHLGYQVKYVRNITDVGHLVNDGDEGEGEDKVGRMARMQQTSPMEVAHKYIQSYHDDMRRLNVLSPNIEPQASGHIVEQITLINRLLQKGYAYHVNGSVYFDVLKYDKAYTYGILSGRKIDELISGTRELYQQGEKRNALDFALWKKASSDHLMQWSSPWGNGFPGWHLECSSMSTKYLGSRFDIHGGGLDLCFPHHECEIAQSKAGYGSQPANYWVHNNLVTIDGEKMSKSAGNFITLADCFQGSHPLLSQPYNPMVLRFFMLQAHYRSTISFSDQALQAAEKGYYKLLNTYKLLQAMHHSGREVVDKDEKINGEIRGLCKACYTAICYDFNTAKVMGYLFDLARYINAIHTQALGMHSIEPIVWQAMKGVYTSFVHDVLGLGILPHIEVKGFVEGLLELYREAKVEKDYKQVDSLRLLLKRQGIMVQDGRRGIDWCYGY